MCKKKFLVFLMFFTSMSRGNFGGFAISEELFDFIREHLVPGKTLLELGSGAGTEELAQYYTMYSIEHNKEWVNKYQSTYIYAPIENYGAYRWYAVDVIARELPQDYDAILIDGPTGAIGRYGFFHNLSLFKQNVLMIFDDVNRQAERQLLEDVAAVLNKPYTIHKCRDGKWFGVIFPVINS